MELPPVDDEITIVSEIELSKGDPRSISHHSHVHTPGGRCVKRRAGPRCDEPTVKVDHAAGIITKADLDPKDQRIEQLKKERDTAREESRQLRLQLIEVKTKTEIFLNEVYAIVRF
jgi:hypothetical protein